MNDLEHQLFMCDCAVDDIKFETEQIGWFKAFLVRNRSNVENKHWALEMIGLCQKNIRKSKDDIKNREKEYFFEHYNPMG